MPSIFQKLNLGSRAVIVVQNAPASFEPELTTLPDVTIHRDPKRLKTIGFALVFVQTLAEIEAVTRWLGRAKGDAIVWFAYPKQSSKTYTCEFHRDTGWAAVGEAGFEPVRMVAIDADWSALRFRRTEFISKLTRNKSHAISEAGRKRVS